MLRRDWIREISAKTGSGASFAVHAIVEIPKGKRTKYEIDKQTGLVRLDRYLYCASHYPGDYGFIPRTLAEDGDALDILVMVSEPTFSGCLIEARPIGLFRMKDQGDNDFKVLGAPSTDPMFDEFRKLSDAPKAFLREVEHFFATYKELEGKKVEILGWAGSYEAEREVEDAIKRFVAEEARTGQI
jgi:inorganic pyrophosphatase